MCASERDICTATAAQSNTPNTISIASVITTAPGNKAMNKSMCVLMPKG